MYLIYFQPTYGSWETDFFWKLTINVAPATNQIKQFRQKSYEMRETIQ